MPLLNDLCFISFYFIKKLLKLFIENKPFKDNKLMIDIFSNMPIIKNIVKDEWEINRNIVFIKMVVEKKRI